MFGGATAFRSDVFELVNGFANEFYGRGGEDDDMLNRYRHHPMFNLMINTTLDYYSLVCLLQWWIKELPWEIFRCSNVIGHVLLSRYSCLLGSLTLTCVLFCHFINPNARYCHINSSPTSMNNCIPFGQRGIIVLYRRLPIITCGSSHPCSVTSIPGCTYTQHSTSLYSYVWSCIEIKPYLKSRGIPRLYFGYFAGPLFSVWLFTLIGLLGVPPERAMRLEAILFCNGLF